MLIGLLESCVSPGIINFEFDLARCRIDANGALGAPRSFFGVGLVTSVLDKFTELSHRHLIGAQIKWLGNAHAMLRVLVFDKLLYHIGGGFLKVSLPRFFLPGMA